MAARRRLVEEGIMWWGQAAGSVMVARAVAQSIGNIGILLGCWQLVVGMKKKQTRTWAVEEIIQEWRRSGRSLAAGKEKAGDHRRGWKR